MEAGSGKGKRERHPQLTLQKLRAAQEDLKEERSHAELCIRHKNPHPSLDYWKRRKRWIEYEQKYVARAIKEAQRLWSEFEKSDGRTS